MAEELLLTRTGGTFLLYLDEVIDALEPNLPRRRLGPDLKNSSIWEAARRMPHATSRGGSRTPQSTISVAVRPRSSRRDSTRQGRGWRRGRCRTGSPSPDVLRGRSRRREPGADSRRDRRVEEVDVETDMQQSVFSRHTSQEGAKRRRDAMLQPLYHARSPADRSRPSRASGFETQPAQDDRRNLYKPSQKRWSPTQFDIAG